MSEIRKYAEQYIKSGLVPIPLSKEGDGKGCFLSEWQGEYFEVNDFREDNNIGLNVLLSKLQHLDWDSHNAVTFSSKFCKPTLEGGIIHPDTKKLIVTHFYYTKDGSSGSEYVKRNYPNGKTIAEFRVEGNAVVEPSIAETKLFDNKRVKRQWNKHGKPIAIADPNLFENFNKVCVAAVLREIIKSLNMPIVKLVSCLKRYTKWSDEDIYYFVETVVNEIPDFDKKTNTERKKLRSKIKATLKNWDNEESKAAGYQSFAKHVGLDEVYCRDMFNWIGEITKEGSKDDRKTVIDFTTKAMTEDEFHNEVVRSYLAAPLICDVGLYIVAGKPKQGKSRLLKDLAYKVKNGGDWLGHTVTQGDVLLLALEDNKDSMNIDIKQMGLQNRPKPTTYVESECPSLERGFIESCELWCEKMKNPKLIIIDTFQKIKPLGSQKTKNANAYEVDYHYLSQLHSFAKKQRICVIYVHHLSQADRSHSWDKIMGSTGHQGVTDAMYMLEREEVGNKGTFKGLGRNIAGFEMDIEWNTNQKEPMTFQYVGDSFEIKTKENKREIFKAMKQLSADGIESVKPIDVYKVLNLLNNKEKNTCNKNMQRMRKKAELLEGDKYGTYKLGAAPDQYDDEGNIKISENY